MRSGRWARPDPDTENTALACGQRELGGFSAERDTGRCALERHLLSEEEGDRDQLGSRRAAGKTRDEGSVSTGHGNGGNWEGQELLWRLYPQSLPVACLSVRGE